MTIPSKVAHKAVGAQRAGRRFSSREQAKSMGKRSRTESSGRGGPVSPMHAKQHVTCKDLKVPTRLASCFTRNLVDAMSV